MGKRVMGMERDGGRFRQSQILDTVHPGSYKNRFIGFMDELFTPGSWVESLPRMCCGTRTHVLLIQIEQLPEPRRSEARALYENANSGAMPTVSRRPPERLPTLNDFLDGVIDLKEEDEYEEEEEFVSSRSRVISLADFLAV